MNITSWSVNSCCPVSGFIPMFHEHLSPNSTYLIFPIGSWSCIIRCFFFECLFFPDDTKANPITTTAIIKNLNLIIAVSLVFKSTVLVIPSD